MVVFFNIKLYRSEYFERAEFYAQKNHLARMANNRVENKRMRCRVMPVTIILQSMIVK